MLLTVEVYSCRIRTRNGERCCKTDINKEYATPIHLAEHTRRKGWCEVARSASFSEILRSCREQLCHRHHSQLLDSVMLIDVGNVESGR